MKTSTTIKTLLVAGFCCVSFAVQAAADLPSRIVTGVGQIIAAQGNNAFREIQEELKRNLTNTLRPLLPSPPRNAGGPTTAADNSSLETSRMHQTMPRNVQ